MKYPAAILALAFLAGCMSRRVTVTSEPAGADLTVNDAFVGRTPCTFDFTYYGVYDVLLTKPGYEPLRTCAHTDAPWYEYPPLDLAASALPTGVRTERAWNFRLRPALERGQSRESFESALLERAAELRGR